MPYFNTQGNQIDNQPAPQPLTKCCTKCGTAKPLDAFNRDSNRPDGRRAYCRACHQLSNYTAPARAAAASLRTPPTAQDFVDLITSLPTLEQRVKFTMALMNAMNNVILRNLADCTRPDQKESR